MNTRWNNHRGSGLAFAFILSISSVLAEVEVSISVAPAAAGEKTVAFVRLDDAVGVAGAELVINLPEFVVPGPAQLLSSVGTLQLASRAKPGRIEIALAQGEGMAENSAAVLQIPLLISASAPVGEATVTFERVLLCDADPKIMAGRAMNGVIRVLEPVQDLDQDGLPDRWEVQHFGGTDGAASADSDQDGVPDLKEFIAGTDPRSAESVFRIRDIKDVVQSGDRKMMMQWEGEEGRRYEIQWSDGPLGPNMTWHKVYNPEIRRADAFWTWKDDGTRTPRPETSRERYYRVVLVE